jgi:ribosome-binding protein aMBF1 (putative translation factor)
MNEEQLKRIDRHVGQQLRKARILWDMSQEELVVEINLTFQKVQKYERGMNRFAMTDI